MTLTLEDELDISRGDVIASAQQVPEVARQFEASVVWLNDRPLDPGRTYLLKHTTQTVTAEVKSIRHRVNITSLEREPAGNLEMNSIGVLHLETSRPIYFDPYSQNRITGSFILIDPETNATAGAGMILSAIAIERDRKPIAKKRGRITPAERIARHGHTAATVSLGPRPQLAAVLERKLFETGGAVAIVEHPDLAACPALERAGLLVLRVANERADWDLPEDDESAADQIIASLRESGILLPAEELIWGEGI